MIFICTVVHLFMPAKSCFVVFCCCLFFVVVVVVL